EPFGDFLRSQSLKDATQHFTLALREAHRRFSLRRIDALEQRLQIISLQPNLAAGYLANALAERFRRIVLVEDAGDAGFDELHRLRIGNAGGDHQNLATEPPLPRAGDEIDSAFPAEIEIEQNDIGLGVGQNVQSGGNRFGLTRHGETRLLFEQPHQALTKQRVIVNQQDTKRRGFRHAPATCVRRAASSSTTKHPPAPFCSWRNSPPKLRTMAGETYKPMPAP